MEGLEEIAKELKLVLLLISRIDERVMHIDANQQKLSNRFDEFVEKYNELDRRVVRLESTANSLGNAEDKHYSQLEDLEERITKLEQKFEMQQYREQTWTWWINRIFEYAWKISIIISAAWLLIKFGLGNVNIP